MHLVHVLLYIGAFFVIAFTAILAIGSFIGLASFLVDVLRAGAKAAEAKVEVANDRPAAAPQAVAAANRSETGTLVTVDAKYASC